MNNPQNRTPPNPSPPLESDGNLNTKIQTDVPTPASFKEGYLHGRVSERSIANHRQEIRDETTTNRAVIIGIALTSLAGLVIGCLWFLNQKQEVPTPVLVPSPITTQQPSRETRIIERSTENTQELAPINQQSPTTSQEIQPTIRVPAPSTGQQQTSIQQNTIPSATGTQPRNQAAPTNPNTSQPNTTRQIVPAPSQSPTGNSTSPRTQPNTTNNQSLPTQIQNQAPTGTSTIVQPNTTNQSLPNQTQTQPSTNPSTTTEPNTTNQGLPNQTQNQTQPANSGSTQ